jgi:hypothetical protein
MAYMEEIKDYKKTVLDELWNSMALKEIMEIPSVTYEEFETHVIPYGKNAETITIAGSYILFEVDPRRPIKGHYMEYIIRFWVLVHDEKNLTPRGVRVDLITIQLDKMFGDSRRFGIGEIENQGAPSFITSKGFSGREIRYYTTDFRGQK